MKWLSHLRTINHHRRLVMKYCFRVDLYWQGLTHDLSKYSPAEFLVGARYYQGNRSPNAMERSLNGYSSAWLHHKGRNKHHWEYWTDFVPTGGMGFVGVEMPVKYVVEMFCDRVAASRTYRRGEYTDSDPYDYYIRLGERAMMNPKTAALLERMLISLRDRGEEETFRMIRDDILKRR